ncbi:MAG: hypothetical protein K6E29_07870 [Cyanobacteria bacterium RUI128]|nr:hypothetical protein [Cyanobacteria bacterium RUI128]
MAKKKYVKIDLDNLTEDLTFDSKTKKNALDFVNKTYSSAIKSIAASGNNLVITTKSTDNHTITLTDYFAKNGKHPIKYLCYTSTESPETNLLYYVQERNIKGSAQTITTANKKGKMYGTVFGDTITGTDKANTIYGYGGNDTIYGSLGADTIIAGTTTGTEWNHIDKVIYSSMDELNGDKIKLTKGERFVARIKNVDYDSYDLRVNGKNLDVTLTKGDNKATFSILGFGTKDVNNNANAKKKTEDTSVVGLTTKTLPEIEWIDLKTAVVNSDKGTWHNDNIDRSDYQIKKKGQVITDVNRKGLSINGAAGNDTIVGSIYKDTIKAGTGLTETITGGTGNDALYASTTADSSTTFKFSEGDGKDTVYSGKGADTIELNDISLADLEDKFVRGTTKKTKNDLTINYTENDSVTIKNYFAVDKKGNPTTSVKYLKTNEGTFDLTEVLATLIVSSGTIEGTENDDLILGSAGDDTINGYAGDDEIFGMGGKDTIYGGEGDDIVHVIKGTADDSADIHLGTGNDTVLLDAGTGTGKRHNAHIYFEDGDGNNTLDLSNSSNNSSKIYLHSDDFLQAAETGDGMSDYYYYTGVKDGNDLVLKMSPDDEETFTIKDFYSNQYAVKTGSIESYYYSDREHVLDDNLIDRLYLEGDTVELTAEQASYEETGNAKLIIAPEANIAREFTLTGSENALVINGSNTQTININGQESTVYVYNTGDPTASSSHKNVINIGSDIVTRVHAYGSTNVTMADDSPDGNYIKLYNCRNNSVYTSKNGATEVDMNAMDAAENYIYSQGADLLKFGNGNFKVRLYAPESQGGLDEKTLILSKDTNGVTLINGTSPSDYGVAVVSKTDITHQFADDKTPVDIMFEHHNTTYDGTDSDNYQVNNNYNNLINIKYLDENGDKLYNTTHTLQMYGTWSDGVFDLNTAEVGNKVTITAENATSSVTKKLSEMTQLVDLNMTYYNTDPESYYDKELLFNVKAQNGFLDNRAGLWIEDELTSHKDDYSNYAFTKGNTPGHGKVTINDKGGDDRLKLDMNRNDYRFFVDINESGGVNGDLIVFSHTTDADTDGLLQYLDVAHAGTEDYNAGDLNTIGEYVHIKNSFTSSSYSGAGAIEKIEDNVSIWNAGNVDSYVNAVKTDVVGWIQSYNVAYGADCGSVTEALADGQADTARLNELYAIYCRTDEQWAAL